MRPLFRGLLAKVGALEKMDKLVSRPDPWTRRFTDVRGSPALPTASLLDLLKNTTEVARELTVRESDHTIVLLLQPLGALRISLHLLNM